MLEPIPTVLSFEKKTRRNQTSPPSVYNAERYIISMPQRPELLASVFFGAITIFRAFRGHSGSEKQRRTARRGKKESKKGT